jgi:hypothetical protein
MNLEEMLHFSRMVARYGFGYPMKSKELKEYCAMNAHLIEAAMVREALESQNKSEPTWQERMQKEYCELKERYEKLHKMVTKYEAGTLGFTPNCSLELLCQQKRHMGEYLHDLEIRAEIEGVEL